MQSLIVTGAGELEWHDVPPPRLSASGDVLVRPVASSACDLDRWIVAGRSPFAPPFALGHEAVGEIVDLADDVTDLAVGDLVVVPWHVSCGTCANCVRGLPATCTSVPRLASYGTTAGGRWGGMFDDVVRVPWGEHTLVPVPANVDPFLAAPVADNLTDAFQAVRPTLAAQPETDVLVVGGTPSLGLLVVLCARALNAASVSYVDIDAARRDTAAALGASVIAVDDYPERLDRQFDLVVDASAAKKGFRCALLSTGPGGTCVVRSIYFGELSLPFFPLYGTGVTLITGPPHASPHAPDVLALMQAGRLDPTPALAGPFDYEDAIEVLLTPPAHKPVFVRR
jgi:threonine dehydrogenase-like Zn-dependent dehydrogenase